TAQAIVTAIGHWSCEMHDQNNVFLAIALSVVILIAWQYFFATSFSHKEAARMPAQIDRLAPNAGTSPQIQGTRPEALPLPQQHQRVSRQQALDRSPRIAIETPSLQGSISLKGGRIDDLSLAQYHETTDPKSPLIELFSPSGSAQPFYAEFGWINAS